MSAGGALAVIPARGGSRRVPRKNIREMHGRPLLAYSVEAALGSGLFARVVVLDRRCRDCRRGPGPGR